MKHIVNVKHKEIFVINIYIIQNIDIQIYSK